MFDFFTDKNKKNRTDSIWKKNKKKNPYKEREEQSYFRIYLYLLSIIILIIGGLYILFTHQYFEIKKINVSGLNKIKKKNIISATKGIYSTKKLYFFPGNNYFIFNEKETKKILKEKFPIKKISIEKEFPDTINIAIQEKINTIIYDNGNKYAYIGLDGKVIEIIRKVGKDEWNKVAISTTSTDKNKIRKEHKPSTISLKKEYGNYPIIYDKRDKKIKPSNRVMKTSTVKGILKWYRKLKNNHKKIDYKYFAVESSLKNFIIYTNNNWKIKANINNRVEGQLQKIRYLLNNKLNSKTPRKYIDVRYKDRVFWK